MTPLFLMETYYNVLFLNSNIYNTVILPLEKILIFLNIKNSKRNQGV